jgi:hypothetical protein
MLRGGVIASWTLVADRSAAMASRITWSGVWLCSPFVVPPAAAPVRIEAGLPQPPAAWATTETTAAAMIIRARRITFTDSMART